MLCPAKDRIDYLVRDLCPDCGGCINDMCRGCGTRWCGGTYSDWQWTMPADREPSPCNRCPDKVDKQITDNQGRQRTIRVRCNADTGHTGAHHWDPHKAGRTDEGKSLP